MTLQDNIQIGSKKSRSVLDTSSGRHQFRCSILNESTTGIFALADQKIVLGGFPLTLYESTQKRYAIGIVLEEGTITTSGEFIFAGLPFEVHSINDSNILPVQSSANNTIFGEIIWHGMPMAVNSSNEMFLINSELSGPADESAEILLHGHPISVKRYGDNWYLLTSSFCDEACLTNCQATPTNIPSITGATGDQCCLDANGSYSLDPTFEVNSSAVGVDYYGWHWDNPVFGDEQRRLHIVHHKVDCITYARLDHTIGGTTCTDFGDQARSGSSPNAGWAIVTNSVLCCQNSNLSGSFELEGLVGGFGECTGQLIIVDLN